MRCVLAPLAIAAAAGLAAAAHAQTIGYTLAWSEVVAGTSTPVANPNGLIEPGEGARIGITITITPGIGATATYTPPPAPGVGTIAGLGSIFFDLHQTNAIGGAWSVFRRQPGWALGGVGTPEPSGGVTAAGAGQFVLPGTTANSTNPIDTIWSATWTPSAYTQRSASFQAAGAVAGGANHSSIMIQYGTDPNNGNPLYVGQFVPGVFGNTGPIPIVPAPAGAALLAAAALARRRCRT